MWETRHSIVDWDCAKIQTLLETLKILNQPRGDFCAIFGSPTFVPKKFGCVRNKLQSLTVLPNQKSFRWMDGLLALDLWDVVIEVLHSSKNTHQAVRDHCRKEKVDDQVPRSRAPGETRSTYPNTKPKRSGNRDAEQLSHVDYVTTNAFSSQCEAQWYVFEVNETVIKMIIKGRSPTMRHVSRTHRVALDWLFDRINLNSKIQIKHVDTKNQLADMLTKSNSPVMSGNIFFVCSAS